MSCRPARAITYGRAPFPPDPLLAGLTIADGQRALGGMDLLPDERVVLWRRQGGRCFWCDEPMVYPHVRLPSGEYDPRGFTLDHLFTRSQGGRDHRKVGACRRCNNRRGAAPAHEFLTRVAIGRGFLTVRQALDMAGGIPC